MAKTPSPMRGTRRLAPVSIPMPAQSTEVPQSELEDRPPELIDLPTILTIKTTRDTQDGTAFIVEVQGAYRLPDGNVSRAMLTKVATSTESLLGFLGETYDKPEEEPAEAV